MHIFLFATMLSLDTICVISVFSFYFLSLPPARSTKGVLHLLSAPKSGFLPCRGNSLHRFWQNLAWRSGPVHVRGLKPPKTGNFTEFWNINATQGRFPCSISTKLSASMRSAFPDWCLKFGRITSRVSKVIGV